MSATLTSYLAKIPPQNQQAPNFIAMLSGLLSAVIAGQQSALSLIDGVFDVDVAVGPQLDAVGAWVGVSRQIAVPIDSVYFSFDTPGLGFDQGIWYAAGDPQSGVSVLPDNVYQVFIQAKILLNTWKGTNSGVQAILDVLMQAFPTGNLWQIDNQDFTVSLNLASTALVALPPILVGLFQSGVFSIKPAGVLAKLQYWQAVVLGYTETAATPIASIGNGAFAFKSQTPGGDCWQGVDDGLHLWAEVTGTSWSATAKVSLTQAGTYSRIGLMVRDTMTDNACVDIIAGAFLNGAGTFTCVYADFSASYPHTPDGTAAANLSGQTQGYVQIIRNGNSVTFSYSLDGVTFVSLITLSPATLPANLYVSACLIAVNAVSSGTITALNLET